MWIRGVANHGGTKWIFHRPGTPCGETISGRVKNSHPIFPSIFHFAHFGRNLPPTLPFGALLPVCPCDRRGREAQAGVVALWRVGAGRSHRRRDLRTRLFRRAATMRRREPGAPAHFVQCFVGSIFRLVCPGTRIAAQWRRRVRATTTHGRRTPSTCCRCCRLGRGHGIHRVCGGPWPWTSALRSLVGRAVLRRCSPRAPAGSCLVFVVGAWRRPAVLRASGRGRARCGRPAAH